MEPMSRNTSYKPSSRNDWYDFFCTSMRLGICITSLIFAKLFRVVVPSCTSFTFNIKGVTPIFFSQKKVEIQRRSAAAGLKFFARPGRGAHILVRINFHFNRAYNIDEQARKVNNYFYINSTK